MSLLLDNIKMPRKYPVSLSVWPNGIYVATTIAGRKFTGSVREISDKEMNEACKECAEMKHCERALQIGDFLKCLMETHSIPVIYECPLHKKFDMDEGDNQ